MSPGLERVALCRCPVGPSGAIPLVTKARCSRGISHVGCNLPAIVGPQLLWAYRLVGLAPSLAVCEGWLRTAVGVLVCKAGPAKWELLWRGASASRGDLPSEAGRNCFGGAGWGGAGGIQGNAGVGHTVLARLMDSDRNGTHQCWLRWVEEELKKKKGTSTSVPGGNSTRSLPLQQSPKIINESPSCMSTFQRARHFSIYCLCAGIQSE